MPHLDNTETTLSRLARDAAAQGLWTLAPARALTLRPRRDGVLHLARGARCSTPSRRGRSVSARAGARVHRPWAAAS
ncbi:hypothetical protein, partial [Ottowia sp.]|uniref:hypothetical protein n=1 Tax=Ottowia sp. TaxID=1898956 RepID=UPI0039E2EE83